MELLVLLFILFVAFIGLAPKELTKIVLVGMWIAIPAAGIISLIWQLVH